MNFGTIFAALLQSGLLQSLIGIFPKIIQAWETSSPTGGMKAVAAAIPANLVAQLAETGAALFPKLSPEIHAAAAALVIAHPNTVSYMQSALNIIKSTGYITFDGQGAIGSNADLVVDGIFGKRTFAAIEALQAKAGLPVTGAIGDAEYNAVTALLQHA